MRSILVVFTFLLGGCNTISEKSIHSKYGKNKIDQTVCTLTDTFLAHWFDDHVHLPKQQSVELIFRRQREKLGANIKHYAKEISPVEDGTKFLIREVFYHRNDLGGGPSFEVMALINGREFEGKLVNISNLFENIETKREDHALGPFAYYCE